MMRHNLLVFLALMMMYSETISGEDFIVAMLGQPFIRAVSGDTPGWIQMPSRPRLHLQRYGEISVALSKTANDGIENMSIPVSTSDASLNIYGEYQQRYFSPLSIGDLGTKYMVSSCHVNSKHTYVLVIATHSMRTEVNITFRLNGSVTFANRTYSDGDTLTFSLESYQTSTIKTVYNLVGTTVTSAFSVAVFSGTLGSSNNYTTPKTYVQLPPVNLYSKEYAIAAGYASTYQLHILGLDNDTQIKFDNESPVSAEQTGFYKRSLESGKNLHFTTTSPVMATLCSENGDVRGFLVVPPVSSNVKEIYLPNGRYYIGDVNILTRDTRDVNVRTSLTPSVSLRWVKIPYSEFQVGTLPRFTNSGITITSTNSTFIVFVYQPNNIYTGRFTFAEDVIRTTTLETSSTTQSSTPAEESGTVTDELVLVTYHVGAGCMMLVLLIIITVQCLKMRRLKRNTYEPDSAPGNVPIVGASVGAYDNLAMENRQQHNYEDIIANTGRRSSDITFDYLHPVHFSDSRF